MRPATLYGMFGREPLRPWHVGLLFPKTIRESLIALHQSGTVPYAEIPNLWQIQLGILRFWHRVFFRSETIGQCDDFPVRPTWRAKLLETRAFRFPFLMRERAIHPLDFSGLASSPERVVSHLMAAHHDGVQFIYDFELLRSRPEYLERVRDQSAAVVAGTHPRGEWLRDLVVYERYHENLLDEVSAFLRGEVRVTPEQENDPDILFSAYLRWCARQPSTPGETARLFLSGGYSIAGGLSEASVRERPSTKRVLRESL